MSGAGIAQIALYVVVLSLLAWPLGIYMAKVYARPTPGRIEGALYRIAGVRHDDDMTWTRYAYSVLAFNVAGIVLVYILQRLQGVLPGNPNDLHAVSPQVSWNTAVSFASNTNWQSYGGETTMSHLVQAMALTVQNFVSAATGMAVLVALVRGFTRKHADGIGNFWVDLTRSTVYILIPLAILLALVLAARGVPQTLDGTDGGGHIAVGPVASQVAIKQLGTNGGGYYNVNSSHPLENPTPLTNFVECLAILLVPAALCITFGRLVERRRQGMAFLVTMWLLFAPFVAVTIWQEQAGNPSFPDEVSQVAGNMEGKEVRFGPSASALWATATTAASNGSVNSMHDSYTPLGGAMPLVLMGLGEVVFGGVGSGLYGLLLFAVVAVFIAGLMVGRTPELMGKKIEAHEMKLASWGILVPAVALLAATAIACLTSQATTVPNPGPHGFSEMLYAMTSAANNNGSAFGGLTASGSFWATTQGILMFLGRYWIIIAVLGMAGSLAKKKIIPTSSGTLPTEGPLFIVLLAGTVLLVGALTLVPALALGPIVEHLQLHP